MSILSAFKHIIPEFHAYSDDEKRYNIGATWTDQDGLRDHHNLELRYVRNSERLALQGEPQPDGSWRYVEANGSVHVISPERAKHFMEQTQAHATIMCGMLEKLKDAGVLDQMLDTTAEPA
jgi:hypothetical protein